MNRDELIDYMQRDWTPAGASNVRFWGERFRNEGWRVVWDAAQALASHARAQRRDYPRDAERQQDLDHHLDLRRLIDRASDVFARR